ncbi:MAG: hypothetical protein ACKVWR_02640 [Acidimicrobiales bacterium]
MLIACWSVKGGSGVSVVAAALAVSLARSSPPGALLVDLGGDSAALLGLRTPPGPGVAEWLAAGADVPADALDRLGVAASPSLTLLPRGEAPLTSAARADVLAELLAGQRRPVVVDCGAVLGADSGAPGEVAAALARAAVQSLLVIRPCYLALRRAAALPLQPAGVVLVSEAQRAITARDVAAVVGAPVVAEVPVRPEVARAVDAGLLAERLPRPLERALRRAA